MEQKLFGFWGYDLFPYILGGEIEEILPYGRIKIKEYGNCISPRSKLITTEESGLELDEKLKELVGRRQEELESISEKYDAELKTLLDEYGVKL
jgi:hypothetical protein